MARNDLSEATGVYYAAGELSRRGWSIGIIHSQIHPDYDLLAAKSGRTLRVQVKGNRSGSQFIFGDKWYDHPKSVEADVVIGVRALGDVPVEFYVGTTSEVCADLRARPNSEWAPWQRSDRYRDRWDKLESEG